MTQMSAGKRHDVPFCFTIDDVSLIQLPQFSLFLHYKINSFHLPTNDIIQKVEKKTI